MPRLALQLLLLLALHQPLAIAATTLEDGYTAFEQGDVNSAVAIWTELAEQGNATAQLNLGQLYRQGKGVPQDDKKAIAWYIKASQNNSDIARYTLGLMHQEGRASDEDLAEAGLVLETHAAAPAQPQATPAAVIPVETRTATAPAGWLRKLPPDAYLIQVVAASKPGSLQDFADDKLPGTSPQPQVVRTVRDGKEWYRLIIGPFSSKQAAQQAVDLLPDTGLANKPWLRTARSLQ